MKNTLTYCHKSYVEQLSLEADEKQITIFETFEEIKNFSPIGVEVYYPLSLISSNAEEVMRLAEGNVFHFFDSNLKILSAIPGKAFKEKKNAFDSLSKASLLEISCLTYVHELNNHLSIISGRIYEFSKIFASIEVPKIHNEKLERGLLSLTDKFEKITAISRNISRKSILNPNLQGQKRVKLKDMLISIKADYRKSFDKNSSEVVLLDELSENLEVANEKSFENSLAILLLRLSDLSKQKNNFEAPVSKSLILLSTIENKLFIKLEFIKSEEEPSSYVNLLWLATLSSNQLKIDSYTCSPKQVELKITIPE